MLYILMIVGLVALDQVVKFWTVATIPLGSSMPFIPHVMDLAYVRNTGAAFSMLSNHTWILALVSAVVALFIAVLLARKEFKHPVAMWSLTVVLAGAIGNLIDRVMLGYVVDMFKTTFMNFAVFNVADICVVCGGIVFCVYYGFYHDKYLEQEGKNNENGTADS